MANTASLQEAADVLGIDQATLWRRRKSLRYLTLSLTVDLAFCKVTSCLDLSNFKASPFSLLITH